MSIGADIAAALPELRAAAESLMVDSCRIERATGTTIDPDTLAEVPVYETVYEGKCRVQRPGSLAPRESVAGGFEFGIDTVEVQAPLSAAGLRKYDRVTMTDVADTTDPDLLGLVATVRANLTKTHPTKRTLICEEVA